MCMADQRQRKNLMYVQINYNVLAQSARVLAFNIPLPLVCFLFAFSSIRFKLFNTFFGFYERNSKALVFKATWHTLHIKIHNIVMSFWAINVTNSEQPMLFHNVIHFGDREKSTACFE